MFESCGYLSQMAMLGGGKVAPCFYVPFCTIYLSKQTALWFTK